MNFECTFIQPQKKRGPIGHRVTQIRQQQTPVQTPTNASPVDALTGSFSYQTGGGSSSGEHGAPESIPSSIQNNNTTTTTTTNNNVAPWPTQGEAPVPTDVSQSQPAGWQNGVAAWPERDDVEYWLPDAIGGAAQMPIFNFPHSNIYLKTSLPSIVQDDPNSTLLRSSHVEPSGAPVTPVGMMPPAPNQRSAWPPSIVEANMIPWIDVYFDRLHATLPLLNRSSLFIRLLSQEHRTNPQFGSMLLALCAFSLTQPIDINERSTSLSRAHQARSMMNEAIKMRSCSDFGEHPTIEAVLTSFFLFGCLFGSNQHNAAWLRLREALDLAAALGLSNPHLYADLPSVDRGQYLRTYLVLSITERAYALQRRHPITFWGRPSLSMSSVHDFIHNATNSLVSGIVVHNEKDAEGMLGLAYLMELFDAIDEDVIDCWSRRCNINSGFCPKLTAAKALSIHEILNHVSESEALSGYDWFERSKLHQPTGHNVHPVLGLRGTQCADVFITKKWLQNRVWVLCSTHGLLVHTSEYRELCFNYAITVAEETLQICRKLRLSSMEAHGIGLVEKLYDIAVSAICVLFNVQVPPSDDNDLGAPDSTVSDGVTPPQGLTPPITQTSSTPRLSHPLAENFLFVLSNLRGGRHPFLPKFKAFLRMTHVAQ
ncbi:hypothetical protein ARAM_003121 [Aspergillus rambellii]|uniref:Transcription factor domain-containing protein n=1 Tax=Aspergillus rambellii TaxID=308745 RepID=A0A0F8W5V9_9EURO|nr:hypothetical protein ARAM_003121 [Aspergillus rambellii]